MSLGFWLAIGILVDVALIWGAVLYARRLGLDTVFWAVLTLIFGPLTLLAMRLVAGRQRSPT